MSEIPTPDPTIAERPANRLPGGFALLLALVLLAGGIAVAATTQQFGWLAVSVLGLIMFRGLFVLPPGVAAVIQFFGRYTGTVRTPGLHFVNPLSNRQRLSVRIRNHETAVAKVNDAEGNPIEMAVVVVWQIEDTARAAFEVDDFVRFVGIQTDTAVRHIAPATRTTTTTTTTGCRCGRTPRRSPASWRPRSPSGSGRPACGSSSPG